MCPQRRRGMAKDYPFLQASSTPGATPIGQHVNAVFGHGNRVLEVGARAPVERPNGPPVRHDLDLIGPLVDHGLESYGHALSETLPHGRLAVVRHLRLLVHPPADAVSDEVLDHRIAGALDELLDGVSNVSNPRIAAAARPGVFAELGRRFLGPEIDAVETAPDTGGAGSGGAGGRPPSGTTESVLNKALTT